MKKLILTALVLMATIAGTAQTHIPPIFGGDSANFRHDIMTRSFITPKRVVWTNSSDAVQNAELLLKKNTGQPDIFDTGMCRLVSHEGGDASIILDFGHELHGGLKLVISSCTPTETPLLRVRFGESVSETCAELNTGKSIAETGSKAEVDLKTNTATNDHAVRDMQIKVPFYGQIEVGNTGYRFVRIDLLTPGQTINLKEATAILRYRDIAYTGSFKSSDKRLNDIWMTGAYTVHLNMQEYIWDGVKRDRLVWMGDMHPETHTISTVFGDNDIFYSTLDLVCKQYPVTRWINDMSAYSLWYLIIQYDWYMRFGHKDFLERHRDYILSLVDKIDRCIDDNGNDDMGWHFLDWPSTPNEKGVDAGFHALTVWAMNDAAKLCRILGDEGKARKSEGVVARLKRKTTDPNNLKQAAALMAIAGLMTPSQACKDYVAVDGARGFSTFYGYYMLEALAMDGRYDEALKIISDFWGGMIDMGATTFWEDFNLDWTKNAFRIDELPVEGKQDIHGDFGAYCYPGYRHSLCHGWASGPTAWLSRHVLGVEILEPGCRRVRITPHLGHLQWAEGTYPTPYGVIRVRHERMNDGTIRSDIKVPKGVKVVK